MNGWKINLDKSSDLSEMKKSLLFFTNLLSKQWTKKNVIKTVINKGFVDLVRVLSDITVSLKKDFGQKDVPHHKNTTGSTRNTSTSYTIKGKYRLATTSTPSPPSRSGSWDNVEFHEKAAINASAAAAADCTVLEQHSDRCRMAWGDKQTDKHTNTHRQTLWLIYWTGLEAGLVKSSGKI